MLEEKDGHTGVASFLKGESENYSFLDAYYQRQRASKKASRSERPRSTRSETVQKFPDALIQILPTIL